MKILDVNQQNYLLVFCINKLHEPLTLSLNLMFYFLKTGNQTRWVIYFKNTLFYGHL